MHYPALGTDCFPALAGVGCFLALVVFCFPAVGVGGFPALGVCCFPALKVGGYPALGFGCSYSMNSVWLIMPLERLLIGCAITFVVCVQN